MYICHRYSPSVGMLKGNDVLVKYGSIFIVPEFSKSVFYLLNVLNSRRVLGLAVSMMSLTVAASQCLLELRAVSWGFSYAALPLTLVGVLNNNF